MGRGVQLQNIFELQSDLAEIDSFLRRQKKVCFKW